jgi:hypothetical protein
MSAYQSLREDGAAVTLIATPNGRASYGVFAYRPGEPQTPIHGADANLNDESERAKFLERLPVELQTEAAPMLLRLAAGAAVTRLTAKTPASDIDPLKPDDPWSEAVNGPTLLTELAGFIRRYVFMTSAAVDAVVLWILHSYLIDIADYTPYLHVRSPVRQCGKTVVLEMLANLAYRAQLTGGISAAALYRRIHRTAATMLLDEMDSRLKADGGENLRNVLNTGFQRNGKFTICVGDDHEDQDFSTWGPKVIAGIGRLWDTVTSRSIPIHMTRAPKSELRKLVKVRGDRIHETCRPFRQQLRRYADDIRDALRDADPLTPDELDARQSDIWRPLLAIADAAGGEWPDRAREAAKALHGVGDDEGDYGLLLLQDVHDLFDAQSKVVALPSAFIVQELIKREDRPWPEFKAGKEITPRGVASLLGRFSVKPDTIRFPNGLAKGYRLADLKPAFETYLTPAAESVTSVTSADQSGVVTAVTDKNEGVSTAAGQPEGNQAVADTMERHRRRLSEANYEADERAGMAEEGT